MLINKEILKKCVIIENIETKQKYILLPGNNFDISKFTVVDSVNNLYRQQALDKIKELYFNSIELRNCSNCKEKGVYEYT